MTPRKRWALLIAALVILALVTAVAVAADPSPQQQLTALKKQLRVANLKLGDQQDEISAQDDLITDQAATIARLRTRLANQPDPVDVITARDPDDMWSAMVAIWHAFPTLPAGSLCGYDKAGTQNDGLTPASFTFYLWSAC